MFGRKKRPTITSPYNFEHRVHTNFNAEEGRYEGLPVQVKTNAKDFYGVTDFFKSFYWITYIISI